MPWSTMAPAERPFSRKFARTSLLFTQAAQSCHIEMVSPLWRTPMRPESGITQWTRLNRAPCWAPHWPESSIWKPYAPSTELWGQQSKWGRKMLKSSSTPLVSIWKRNLFFALKQCFQKFQATFGQETLVSTRFGRAHMTLLGLPWPLPGSWPRSKGQNFIILALPPILSWLFKSWKSMARLRPLFQRCLHTCYSWGKLVLSLFCGVGTVPWLISHHHAPLANTTSQSEKAACSQWACLAEWLGAN